MPDLVAEAYEHLMQKPCPYETKLTYSGRFKSYNAHLRRTWKLLEVRASREWEDIDRDIQRGLIQSLLSRFYKSAPRTSYIDLYDAFIRNLHKAIINHVQDPLLKASFERVNERMLDGMLGECNLKWSGSSARVLGTYEYASDTIRISKAVAHDLELLDYVMYHEMLHKKHKFYTAGRRTFHHTRAFLRDEKKFPGRDALERRLSYLCRRRGLRRDGS